MPSLIAKFHRWMPPKRLGCAGTERAASGSQGARTVGTASHSVARPRIGPALAAAFVLAARRRLCGAARGRFGLTASTIHPASPTARSMTNSMPLWPDARSRRRSPPTMPSSRRASSILPAPEMCRSIRHSQEKVKSATAEAATTRHKAQSFARGLITGEPDDMAALAGTAVGDLFVFGDIRDALREGKRLASGEQADELVLGLACVGIAITAGTYLTFGAAAPARAGLTLVKVARKTGSLGAELAGNIGRMVRQAGFTGASPVLAVRAARDAVKVERAGGLLHLARDVGRVEQAAGGRAAFDGLKVAKEPADMTRVAKARGEGRKPHARHSQARGSRRDHARRACLRCKRLADRRLVCRLRLRLRAQECDRTDRPAILPPPQGKAQAEAVAAGCCRPRARLNIRTCQVSGTATSRSPISTRVRASRSCWSMASPPPRK